MPTNNLTDTPVDLVALGKKVGGFLMQSLATYIVDEAAKRLESTIKARVDQLLTSDKFAIEIESKHEGYL